MPLLNFIAKNLHPLNFYKIRKAFWFTIFFVIITLLLVKNLRKEILFMIKFWRTLGITRMEILRRKPVNTIRITWPSQSKIPSPAVFTFGILRMETGENRPTRKGDWNFLGGTSMTKSHTPTSIPVSTVKSSETQCHHYFAFYFNPYLGMITASW